MVHYHQLWPGIQLDELSKPAKEMERIVFYGKGGIGKSTTSTNITATLARRGLRVLHVGCDPKRDSTVALMDGQMITAVIDKDYKGDHIDPSTVVTRSRLGVDCAEAGGPHAGVGCAGRGISRMLEIFKKADLLSNDRYDVAVFDVLGDVVCGGFAAPLRRDMGRKVVIVTSEEVMSMYAANNIAKAVVNYASNGIVCVGIILNLRDNTEDTSPIHRFAKLINTKIIGTIPREKLIREAEYRKITVVEHAPHSDIARVFGTLADTILNIDPGDCPLPTPLSDEDFYAYTQRRFKEGPTPPPRTQARKTAPEIVEAPVAAPKAADVRNSAYRRELKAGALAVRMGRVRADEAARRLRAAYPVLGASLRATDLTT